MKKEILNAEGKTIILFSKNETIIQLSPIEVEKMSRILYLLQERSEDEESEDKEVLYGTLVDCFEEESYFTNTKDHDVPPRNLVITKSTENENCNSTTIAFGYLNSKDCYIEPSELEFLKEDLTWFVNESDKATDETKVFINSLIEEIKKELEGIKNGENWNGLSYED